MGDPLLHKSARPLPYSRPPATFPHLKAKGVANFPCLPSQVSLATQQISTRVLPLHPQEEFPKYLQLHHSSTILPQANRKNLKNTSFNKNETHSRTA